MVEPLLFLLFVGGAIGLGGLVYSHRRVRALEKAAVSCGLQIASEGMPVEAWRERLMVRIEPAGDKGQAVRVTVFVPGPPDSIALRLRPESPFVQGGEIEVGDVSFDSTFFVEGPPPQVLALLDAETRRLLFRAGTESRLEMSSGSLKAYMADKKVSDLLPLLIEAAERLALPMEIPQRLAENARKDPAARARLHNLHLLIREFPGEPETVEALRAASTDPSPEVRLRAAKELRAEGHSLLLELAESLEDDVISAEAVATLEREGKLPFEILKRILLRAARGRRLKTARACLVAFGYRRAAEAAGLLVEVMEQEEGELAAVAAWALGTIGSPANEPALIQALKRDLAGLRVAAAEALGRVGSVTAVFPLKEAAEGSRFDLELRRATRQAIAEIQSRLPGASPGQLSLAGAEAGQLSLAADPAGQVSLSGAEEPALPAGSPTAAAAQHQVEHDGEED